MNNGAADAQALARATALIQAGSQLLKSVQQPGTLSPSETQAQFHSEQDQHTLRRERELLAARVLFLKQEVQRRERTVEGLTWLIGNLPEHQGREVVVDLQHEDVHPEMMVAMQEAEDILRSGPPGYLTEAMRNTSNAKSGNVPDVPTAS